MSHYGGPRPRASCKRRISTSNVVEQVASNLVTTIPDGKSAIDAVELTAKLPVQAAVHAFGVPEEDLDLVVPRVNIIMTYWSGPQD